MDKQKTTKRRLIPRASAAALPIRLRRLLPPPGRRDPEAGWTFVETLIVIGIILVLSTSVGFMAFRYFDRAKVAAARSQIETFTLALNAYLLDCEQFPTQDQGLTALWEKPVLAPVPANWKGPYVNKEIPTDPWDRPYLYTVPGPNGLPFGIRSYGADGVEGGEGDARDIVSWKN